MVVSFYNLNRHKDNYSAKFAAKTGLCHMS